MVLGKYHGHSTKETSMKPLLRWVVLATVLAAPLTAQSRGRPFEFGFDAGFSHTSFNGPTSGTSTSVSEWDFPLQGVRGTIPLNGQFALEPAVAWTTASGPGNTRSTAFNGDLGLLIDLNGTRSEPQFFLRPFVGLDHGGVTIAGVNSSTDRATLGVGAGLRVPATDRIAMRYEARYRYLTEADGISGNVIGFLVGVSISTR
jgi:hypothetical protein